MTAAKHMDPVVGVDMHMVQPPPPAPPVMLPVPFAGYLLDPADYGSCKVMINGLPRARAGTPGMGCPPHIPPGGMFVKPPTNECEMYQGSSTVVIEGDAPRRRAIRCSRATTWACLRPCARGRSRRRSR